MPRIAILLVLTGVLGLTGCTTATKEQQVDFLDRFSPGYVQRQRMAQQCTAYGPKGSPGYAGCMLKVEEIMAQQTAALARPRSVTCMNMGAGMVTCD